MSAMNRRVASRRAKDRHWALLGAVAAGMGLASQVHAQDVPDVPPGVATATLAGFLPAADPGLEFVDAASAMPADFIRQSLPDALGRQWLNVSRTYWSYPIPPGLGALPPESSGLLAVPENMLHHAEAAVMAHPGGALQAGIGAFVNVGSSVITLIPGLGTVVGSTLTILSNVGAPVFGALGNFANVLIDWAPGLPPVYQVSIDYFKVGEVQPAVADAARDTFGPVRATVGGAVHSVTDPLRATVGGAVHSVTDPVRAAVGGAVHSVTDAVRSAIADAANSATGSACRLTYTEEVNLFPVDPATLPPDQPQPAPWPPAVEAGFDCGGVMNRRMSVIVGAGFAGGEEAGLVPIWYEPFTAQWVDYVGTGLLTSLLNPTLAAAPAESLVVTIDSVKSSEDLHRLAQSIDYRGLCLAVHPDGEGCPSQ